VGDKIKTEKIATKRGQRSNKEYESILREFLKKNRTRSIAGCVLSSVIPEETGSIAVAIKSIINTDPIIVNHRLNTGLRFMIKNPSWLGADRIANAVAAYHLYKRDCIVLDFGTATTCCLITGDGRFLGGAIMPGPGISVEALSKNTALLPKIDLDHPVQLLGSDTYGNIASGVILGQAGAVERIIKEMKEEINSDPIIIVTGGYAELIAPYIKADHIDPLLTLRGLIVIYWLNS